MRKTLRTRFFHVWFRWRRAMTLGVRVAVENAEGRVLLVRHTYTDGLYLPGGGVEPGEHAALSAERELLEEVGVVRTGALELIGVYSSDPFFRGDHVLFYRLPEGAWRQGEPTSRGEISERMWIDPRNVPADATPGTRRRLAELYAGGEASPFW